MTRPLHRTVFALLLLAAVPTTAAGKKADPLWDKAVALSGANEDQVAASIHSRSEILDKQGEAKRVDETWVTLSVGDGGKIVSTVDRAVEDGKDVTSAMRESMREKARKKADEDGDDGELGPDFLPFVAANQKRVEATPTEETRVIGGRTGTGYNVRYQTDDGDTLVGTTWLDLETGAPLLLKVKPDPLPPMVDELETEVFFGPTANGGWAIVRFVIAGAGGVVLIKKRFRADVTLTDHFRHQEP